MRLLTPEDSAHQPGGREAFEARITGEHALHPAPPPDRVPAEEDDTEDRQRQANGQDRRDNADRYRNDDQTKAKYRETLAHKIAKKPGDCELASKAGALPRLWLHVWHMLDYAHSHLSG